MGLCHIIIVEVVVVVVQEQEQQQLHGRNLEIITPIKNDLYVWDAGA